MSNPQDNQITKDLRSHQDETGQSVTIVVEADDPRCISRVSPFLHVRKQVYQPEVISLGPYHHGKPEFSEMEKLKQKQLDLFMSKSENERSNMGKELYYQEIMKKIKDIRGNYEEVEYNNEKLAKIILRDACFLISLMEPSLREHMIPDFESRGGLAMYDQLGRDLYKLENQIPFWIIKDLYKLRYANGDADKLVYDFIRNANSLDSNKEKGAPWKAKTRPPLHLLEAYQEILMEQGQGAADVPNVLATCLLKCKNIWKESLKTCRRSSGKSDEGRPVVTNFPLRSVTYLQRKGIHFKPSSNSLQEITFESSYFSGILRLPILLVDRETEVIFSNIMALEICSNDGWKNGYTLSYVNFMKSLIHTAKDVTELQERGILINKLGSDEDVVNLFKGFCTYGTDNIVKSFEKVKEAINKHCNSKIRLWMADLKHTYCHSPWPVIAILATIAMLSMTAIQVHYAIHPAH